MDNHKKQKGGLNMEKESIKLYVGMYLKDRQPYSQAILGTCQEKSMAYLYASAVPYGYDVISASVVDVVDDYGIDIVKEEDVKEKDTELRLFLIIYVNKETKRVKTFFVVGRDEEDAYLQLHKQKGEELNITFSDSHDIDCRDFTQTDGYRVVPRKIKQTHAS